MTVQVEWPFIKPKRAELVDAVPLRAGGTALLYFCPVERAAAKEQSLDQTFCDEKQWPGSKWTRLSTVLGSLRPLGEPALQLTQDAAALFAALDAWLSETHVLPQTVVTLWRHSAAFRLKQVVRNPMRARGKSPAVALPRQYAVKNPLFNSGLAMFTAGTNFEDLHTNYADEYTAGEAQAVADAKLQRGPTSTNLGPKGPHRASRAASPAEARGPSWGQKYPMHKAAVMGDMGLVRNLIKEGQSPSLPDADKWTPLHYASWHGQTAVVGELMRDWQGGPMDLTDNGSSALHFAARNGYPDVVTILLACPIIKVDAEDNDKKTPLMLCESLQQGQWSEVAKILKDPNAQKAVNRFGSLNLADGDHVFHDFRIFVLDGTEKVIRLPDAIKTSQLRDGIAGMLQIPEDCYHLFAIWIKSPSLEIQLEDDMEPMDRIKRWPKMAELYTEPESWGEWRRLVFKRNQFTSLREERKTRSPVALKYLFEEALQMLICSWWPCSVDDAIFLAGLLMQIRYGDYNPTKHKTGYLSGDADHLKTFVPTHLFHNQLKNFEWERRIFEAHKAHVGKTDIHLLHRLFLQYCWQWPYYGATFFEAELPKARRAKNEPIRVGITCDWCCIILDPSLETMSLKASIAVDQTSHTFDEAKRTLLKIRCGDVSQASGLQQFLRGGPLDIINIVSLQATLMNRMFTSIRNLLKALDDDVRRKRMAQGGPRENRLVSQAPTAPAVDVAELKAYNMRSERERHKRYALLHSFGEQIGEEGKFAAQALFENRATCIDRYVPLQELNQIFMELVRLPPPLQLRRAVRCGQNVAPAGGCLFSVQSCLALGLFASS